MPKRLLVFASLFAAHAVQAQEARPLCVDRPGLGTPPCTVEQGRATIELGLADWTLDRTPESRTDTWVAGDLLLGYGITANTEVLAGWTALGTTRVRDRTTGQVTRGTGTGDVTLAVRQNFSNPDGSGFSIAAMPHVELPVGGKTIGAGTWGAGLIVPATYELSKTVSIALTPEIDAAPDEDRRGRHLSYGSVIGLDVALTSKLDGEIEFQAKRDQDPGGHVTQTFAAAALAWQPNDDLQFDIGAVAGLNRASPDIELYLGIARRL